MGDDSASSRVPRRLRALLLAAALALGAASAGAADILTAADVERITGIRGVTLVPQGAAPAAAGDLNFVDAEGRVLLLVDVDDAARFGAAIGRMRGHAPIPGVGDEAFMPTPTAVYVRKRATFIAVETAEAQDDAKPAIGPDQLKEIARLVASRL